MSCTWKTGPSFVLNHAVPDDGDWSQRSVQCAGEMWSRDLTWSPKEDALDCQFCVQAAGPRPRRSRLIEFDA